MLSSRGIHKTSEQTLLKGRGILVTEKDKLKYNWEEIPPGSKFIDEVTGIEQVKLKDILIDKKTGAPIGYGVAKDGKIYYADKKTPIKKADGTQYRVDDVEYSEESDWVPAGIRNDGTLCIAKDVMICKETFTIYKTDDGTGKMEYINKHGEHRHMPYLEVEVDGEKIQAAVFELEDGGYVMGRNHIDVIVDDCLHRSAHDGSLIEVSEKRFALPEEFYDDTEIEATYLRVSRIGGPYPRIFLNKDRPPESEKGDVWLNFDGFIDTDLGELIDKKILDDEVLDGGLQPKENHTPPDDVEPSEKNRVKDTTHDNSGALILSNSKYKMSVVYPADYNTMYTVPEKLNTTALTMGEAMFEGCKALKLVPTIDTSKFASMKNMFSGCVAMYNNDPADHETTYKEFPWIIDCASIASLDKFSNMFQGTTVNRIKLTNVRAGLVDKIDFNTFGTSHRLMHVEINGTKMLQRATIS